MVSVGFEGCDLVAHIKVSSPSGMQMHAGLLRMHR